MKTLFNPEKNEMVLMRNGNEIIIPAGSEFTVTEEDAEFVLNTLGFIEVISSSKAKKVSVPAPKEVVETEEVVDEGKEVVETEEDIVEETIEESKKKTNKK